MTKLGVIWLRTAFLAMLVLFSQARAEDPSRPEDIARQILAPLLDPVKVATLKGDRPANRRLYQVLYWLETARLQGGDVSVVVDTAQAAVGYAGTKCAVADKKAILWNHRKLVDFGCFSPEDMAKLRKGGSPSISKGVPSGTQIALDHILPRAVVPELAARFYNLEAIPARENLMKSSKVGKRELLLAERWNREGLLSAEGLKSVIEAAGDS
jgi:hypothetical protein